MFMTLCYQLPITLAHDPVTNNPNAQVAMSKYRIAGIFRGYKLSRNKQQVSAACMHVILVREYKCSRQFNQRKHLCPQNIPAIRYVVAKLIYNVNTQIQYTTKLYHDHPVIFFWLKEHLSHFLCVNSLTRAPGVEGPGKVHQCLTQAYVADLPVQRIIVRVVIQNLFVFLWRSNEWQHS